MAGRRRKSPATSWSGSRTRLPVQSSAAGPRPVGSSKSGQASASRLSPGTAWSGPPAEQADSDIYTAIVRPISSAAVSGNSPATGPTIGGTTVVITGSGFSALSGASAASKSSAVVGCPGRRNGLGGLLRGRPCPQLHHRLRQADHRGRSPARGGQGGRLRGDEHRSFRQGGQRQRLHLRSCQPHPDREHRLSPPLLRARGHRARPLPASIPAEAARPRSPPAPP